jgi:membrane protein required for colicin V production
VYWLDWILIAILLLSVLRGFHNGLLLEIFSLVGLVLGLLAAGRYWPRAYPVFSGWVHSVWGADLCAFLLVAFVVMLATALLGHLLKRTVQAIGLGWADKLLGGVFGFLRGCVVLVIGFFVFAAIYPQAPWLQNCMHQSRIAPLLLSAVPRALEGAPASALQRVTVVIRSVGEQFIPGK